MGASSGVAGFINGRVLTDTGFRHDLAVLLRGGCIQALLPHDDPRVTEGRSGWTCGEVCCCLGLSIFR